MLRYIARNTTQHPGQQALAGGVLESAEPSKAPVAGAMQRCASELRAITATVDLIAQQSDDVPSSHTAAAAAGLAHIIAPPRTPQPSVPHAVTSRSDATIAVSRKVASPSTTQATVAWIPPPATASDKTGSAVNIPAKNTFPKSTAHASTGINKVRGQSISLARFTPADWSDCNDIKAVRVCQNTIGCMVERSGQFCVEVRDKGADTAPPTNPPAQSTAQHVVITTFRSSANALGAATQRNARTIWSALGPRVHLMTFEKCRPSGSVECNVHDKPLLGSMYAAAFKEYPTADTYTYFNGDLLTDGSFVLTADAVVAAVRARQLSGRFLVVGRRTNIAWWQRDNSTVDADFDVQAAYERAEGYVSATGRDDAEDYFMISRHSFNWASGVPRFVVGRPGYDNWCFPCNASCETLTTLCEH